MVIGELVHNPVDQLLQEFAFDRPTGFADGRQHGPSPVLRTALVERTHQQTVRCADEIHVAGLPLAVAHLAISQAQLLLPVPMKRLGAWGIRLRRDNEVSVRYAEELNSGKSSVTLQRADRHGILGQKSTNFQVSL